MNQELEISTTSLEAYQAARLLVLTLARLPRPEELLRMRSLIGQSVPDCIEFGEDRSDISQGVVSNLEVLGPASLESPAIEEIVPTLPAAT